MAGVIWSCMATSSTWWSSTRAGWRCLATPPTTSPSSINRYFNAIRRRLGFSYWSLSQWAKHKVKNAVNYIGAFEQTLAAEAQRHHVDGVICGHIHHAVIHDDFGIRYVNCGDWVESCTAVAEHADGRLEIISWTGEDERREAAGGLAG